MQLPYRPKFLPRDRETGAQRVRRRLAVRPTRTPFAPEPRVAPAAIYGDATRIYTPGPVLIDRDGVYLFHDRDLAAWSQDHEPTTPRAVPPPAWMLWLQGVLLVGAILACGVVELGVSR